MVSRPVPKKFLTHHTSKLSVSSLLIACRSVSFMFLKPPHKENVRIFVVNELILEAYHNDQILSAQCQWISDYEEPNQIN